ncbi:hypothetical protein C5167_050853 [Papaver somniferum]|uniref:Reverse transcriptase zinc-binding domain-containing protein n=1 Tax=Papaver somniferum TaxID=3469 RepID=A0A4Y7KSJ8_PAPSO|nr:hypothetical protein C5167_050853 [Papaver somniferum]
MKKLTTRQHIPSSAGRTALSKSVLSSIATLLMVECILLKGVLQHIMKIQRSFWCGYDTSHVKLYFISWNYGKRFASKRWMVVLGVRDTEFINKSLVVKLAWRFLTNPNVM